MRIFLSYRSVDATQGEWLTKYFQDQNDSVVVAVEHALDPLERTRISVSLATCDQVLCIAVEADVDDAAEWFAFIRTEADRLGKPIHFMRPGSTIPMASPIGTEDLTQEESDNPTWLSNFDEPMADSAAVDNEIAGASEVADGLAQEGSDVPDWLRSFDSPMVDSAVVNRESTSESSEDDADGLERRKTVSKKSAEDEKTEKPNLETAYGGGSGGSGGAREHEARDKDKADYRRDLEGTALDNLAIDPDRLFDPDGLFSSAESPESVDTKKSFRDFLASQDDLDLDDSLSSANSLGPGAPKPEPPIPRPSTTSPGGGGTQPSVPPQEPPEMASVAGRLRATPVKQPGDRVRFTTFYPREVSAGTRYGLYLYSHTRQALDSVQNDVRKFEQELGGHLPLPRTAAKQAILATGTPVTVTPECEAIEFDPPSLTRKWEAPWKRYEFEFTPKAALVGKACEGRIVISVHGIEIASVKFAMEVTQATATGSSEFKRDPRWPIGKLLNRPANPLAAAKAMHSETGEMYHRIFVSYSRTDKTVAELYRLAQLALGNDVFMDTYSIRTGEDWRAALARAIDDADVFQLFWSKDAAASENVRDEWQYALQYRCSENDCRDFIRPIYWMNPIPVQPPTELSHLNFRFVPLLSVGGQG